MYTPQAQVDASFLSTIMPSLPVDKPSRLSLDTAGVTSLLGGGDAVSAMTTVHIYENRRWLGWFNNPGSFIMAGHFNTFAKSATFHNSFSGKHSKSVQMDPTTLLGVENRKGPKFRAVHSGTVIDETGPMAALFVRECAAWDSEGKVLPGRRTQPIGITIADLGPAPPSEMHPARSNASTLFFASVPIAVSIGTCVACAVFEDWYASSLILIGILASGLSSSVIGSADFVFTHPEPAKGSPPGDGILGSDKDIILLRGTEGAVNSITRGEFTLGFSSNCHYKLIQWCSILLFVQSITQLFLIPQASLFGQVMFLSSIGVSALYNSWLSSFDKEKIHRRLLVERVLASPTLTKYTLGTRTSAVVFTLLVLQLQDPTKILNELLPNDTKVWKHWKATILERLRQPSDQAFQFGSRASDVNGFTTEEKDLMKLLYEDARSAYNGYKDYHQID